MFTRDHKSMTVSISFFKDRLDNRHNLESRFSNKNVSEGFGFSYKDKKAPGSFC